jgi:hypothetical protein
MLTVSVLYMFMFIGGLAIYCNYEFGYYEIIRHLRSCKPEDVNMLKSETLAC